MEARATVECRTNVQVDTVCARTGRVLKRTRHHNLVVDQGLLLLRDLLYGDFVAPTHCAVGTDSTAPTDVDTELGHEVFRDLITSRTKVVGLPPQLLAKFVIGSQSGNGQVLREVGLFNAASAGTLFARVVIEAVTKTDAILVIVSWSITFTAVAV